MTKVKYHDKEIELIDELEPGYYELDLRSPDNSHDDLEKTKEIKINNLDDTQILNVGDKHE